MRLNKFTFSWDRFTGIGGLEWVVAGTFWATWLSINLDWLCVAWFGESVLSSVTHGLIQFQWEAAAEQTGTATGMVLALAVMLAWVVFLHSQNRLFQLWELPTRRTWLMSLVLFCFFLLVIALFHALQIGIEMLLGSASAAPSEIWFWTAKISLLAASMIFTVWLAYAVLGPRVFYQQRAFGAAVWVGVAATGWLVLMLFLHSLIETYFASNWLLTFAMLVMSWIGVFFCVYFGANVVFVATKYGNLVPKHFSAKDAEFIIGYRLVGYLWWAQNSGRQLNEKALLNVMHDANEDQVFSVLEQLQQNSIIHKTQNQFWALSRDLSSMTLLELYRACPGMPGNWRAIELHGDPWDEALEPHILAVTDHIERLWSVGLRELYATAGPFVSQQSG